MHCITNGPGMIHLTSAMQRTFCGPRLANIPDLFCGQCNASTMGIRNSQSGINLTNRSDDTSAPWGVAAPHGAFGCRRLPVITVSKRLASRSSVSSPAVLGPGSDPELSKWHKNRQSKRRYQTPHGAFANAPWGVCVFSAPWRAGWKIECKLVSNNPKPGRTSWLHFFQLVFRFFEPKVRNFAQFLGFGYVGAPLHRVFWDSEVSEKISRRSPQESQKHRNYKGIFLWEGTKP